MVVGGCWSLVFYFCCRHRCCCRCRRRDSTSVSSSLSSSSFVVRRSSFVNIVFRFCHYVFSGPCGQLKTFQTYSRCGHRRCRHRRRRDYRRSSFDARRSLSLFFLSLYIFIPGEAFGPGFSFSVPKGSGDWTCFSTGSDGSFS